MAGPRAAVLLCLALLAAGQAAGQAASDITLSGVTVALLEAGGSEAHSNSVMGPTMMHLGTLDHTRTLKVGTGGGKAAVAAGGGRPQAPCRTRIPNSSPTPPLPTATSQVELSAALAGEPDFRPQQAFVRLTSRASGAAAYFAAVKAKAGKLYATAKVADLQKQVRGGSCARSAVCRRAASGGPARGVPRCLASDPPGVPLLRHPNDVHPLPACPRVQVGQQGGAYDVALLVGDARSAQPLDWALGFVTVLLPPLDDGSQPQDKPYRWAG